MRKKMYWALGVLSVLLIGAFVFRTVKNQQEILQLERDAATLQQQRQPQESAQEPQGHFHDDGTFHAGDPPDPIPQEDTPPLEKHDDPKMQYTAPKGAVLKPIFPKVDPKADPVKAAYKRLEYIKNNPYAWGGVHSPRATELIDQLMPPSELIDHEHGDEVIEQIVELCEQGDPRAAEVLIAHMCYEGGTVGGSMFDALEEIGPPAVPYIIPYLEKGVKQGGYIRIAVFESIGRIGDRYRDDLGGIVQHIIIPKLKVIAADKNNESYESPGPRRARETLEMLE